MASRKCFDCLEFFKIGLERCPHCARPSLFPNVEFAAMPEEIASLDIRYSELRNSLIDAGKKTLLDELESCVIASEACKAMARWEIDRLICSDTATAATYYQQISGKGRIPDDNRWDRLRRIADASFFECYGGDIHFAAISTNRNWLESYGDGAVFFKEDMIGHRATVFEKNTVTWLNETDGNLTIPKGYRAVWSQKEKLAVAKLGDSVSNFPADIHKMLLSCGATSADDIFMEVHIYGGFTILSTKAVVIKSGALGALSLAVAKEKLPKLNISFLEV